jgi:hypothetical protein
MTQAGRVCGIVSVVLALVPLCIGLLALAVAVILAIGAKWLRASNKMNRSNESERFFVRQERRNRQYQSIVDAD